jgi:LysR family glycine cleavage system transcriptional activator
MANRSPSLPSLNALQAFEAAARHESFTRAGQELGVTQTAISHQVKALEGDLGAPLFRRSPRRLSLTPLGQAWAAELLAVFQRLRDANERLRTRALTDRPVIAVTTIPSFGARWLVPRLGRFMNQNPDIDVRISASERLVDFGIEPFDLGIRYGLGRYPGLTCERLADDSWVVVASPELARKLVLKTPTDLRRATLLWDDQRDLWREWFQAVGAREPKSYANTQISDSSMLVEAVVRGQGVGLARWSLACDELTSGKLTRVFPELPLVPTGRSYYLVRPRENLGRRPVSAFCEWVRREAEGLRA